MKHLTDDSRMVKTLINRGREMTMLVRAAVTADRHSRNLSIGRSGINAAWTSAAQSRDDAFKLLRKRLSEIADEL